MRSRSLAYDIVIGAAALVVLALLPFVFPSKALIDFVIRGSALALFATSLNFLVGYGGMVSFVLKGPQSRALDFAHRLRYFSLAESLGGVESLICHPARMTHGSIPKEDRERRGVTDGLLRLSVGIEDADDLIEDLRTALGVAPIHRVADGAHV